MGKVTIKDIARIAKVSPATVSLVMNRRSGVAESTRQRVSQIAAALKYQPNLIARSLVKRRSYAVAMLVSNTKNALFPELVAGVEEVLMEHGYSLSIISTYNDPDREEREIEKIMARGIDGIITSASLRNSHSVASLAGTDYPIVALLRRVEDCDELDFVNVDNLQGGYLAAEHLIRLGHKKIGVIKGLMKTSTGRERFEGALKAFRTYGLSVPDELLVEGDYFKAAGYQAACRLLDLPQERRPTAIFACNDDMAIGAFEAALERGLKTPEDLALVGFNDQDVAALKMVELTTIDQKKDEIGRLAAKRLVDKIEQGAGNKGSFNMILEARLVVRKSCGFHLKSKYSVKKMD